MLVARIKTSARLKKPLDSAADLAPIHGFLAASGVLLLGSALRLYGLDRQSAWADEITTLLITDPALTFAQFWQLVLSDVHPPLYYLLLRYWSAVLGQSDVAARLPSAIFGILTVAAAAFAKPLPAPGRLAFMALLAVSPGAIEYSQEARSYSLLLLFSTVVTSACLGFVGNPMNDRAAVWAIVALAVAGILGSYTHYFGFLLAVGAGMVAVWASRGRQRRAKHAGLALSAIVASFIPWIIYHSYYMSGGARTAGWIADFPLSGTISWFLRLFLGGRAPAAALVLFVGVALATRHFRHFALHDPAMHVGSSVALLALGSAVLVSLHTPILTSRNLIIVLPLLYLMMAALAAYAVSRWRALAAACFGVQLLLMSQALGWYYTAQTKEQWRESASFILGQPDCAEGRIYVFGDTANYRYLVGKSRPRLKLIAIPPDRAATTRIEPPGGDCRVILWAADLSPSEFEQLLSTLHLEHSCMRVTAFYWAFVVTHDAGDLVRSSEPISGVDSRLPPRLAACSCGAATAGPSFCRHGAQAPVSHDVATGCASRCHQSSPAEQLFGSELQE